MSQVIAESPIAEYRPTEAALAELRTKYEAVVYDVTDSKTMALAKAARKELRDVRVALEAERVRIKAPSLQRSRDIDTEAKRITAEIEALEDPIDSQIKAEETRKQREKDEAERIERERVEKLNGRFDALKAQANVPHDFTSDQIKERLAEVGSTEAEGIPDYLMPAWVHEERLVVVSLRASLDKRLVYEAEQVELAALREQKAAMEAEQNRLAEVERQRLADEAARLKAADDIARAEQAAKDAEAAAVQAAIKAEEDQRAAVKAAEERATREAEAREQEKREAEAKQVAADKAEAHRKAANKAHRAKINNAAAAAIGNRGFTAEQAKAIVTMIALGEIPNVTINY